MTDGLRLRDGDQPLPTPGRECVQDRLIAEIEARKQLGIARYGRPLETHNGRDALRDAWEESVDQAVYLTQVIMERADALAESTAGDPAHAKPWSVWRDTWDRWYVYHAPTGSFLGILRDFDEGLRDGDPGIDGLQPLLADRDWKAGESAPHRITLSVRAKSPDGGSSFSVTHPPACDRLPYGTRCWFDEARPELPMELGVYDAVMRDGAVEFLRVRDLEAGDWHG